MTLEEKQQLDVRDFRRIHTGLETYANMGARESLERLRGHKEDAFCEVTAYDGKGKVMCTRDAYNAIHSLAERHRDSMQVPDDYSVNELADGIRAHIVRGIVDEKYAELALARVLAEAVSDADKNHIERTYHFPCVVVPHEEPRQFRVGLVKFTAAKHFSQSIPTEIQQYEESIRDKAYTTEKLTRFAEYIAHLGWVASVRVPPCSEESSMRRAEVAVTTAINLLRLVFGVDYGHDMRLAHSAHALPRQTEHAVFQNGKLDFVLSRKASGAMVEKNWYLILDKWRDFSTGAAHLVSTAVDGKRSEAADRLIDALTWFGDAAFESSSGMQIVNFVAALERLTTTEAFRPHNFCSRVALLALEDDSKFEKTYWDALDIYAARSGIIHGGLSPSSRAFRKSVRLAHDVTRNALLRALEVHRFLDISGKPRDLAGLRSFFASQQSKRAALLLRLSKELKKKKKASLQGN